MSELVKRNYSPVISQNVTTDLTPEEEDISEYVAGYLLHRLAKHSAVVSHLKDDEGGQLVTLLERGGLTKPSVKFEFLFLVRQTEAAFRAQSDSDMNRQRFASQLGIFDQLSVLLCECECADAIETFYADLVNLFHTVRAHQRARKVLLCECECADAIETFYADLVNLFHTVRAHQPARKVFELLTKTDPHRRRPLRDYLFSKKELGDDDS